MPVGMTDNTGEVRISICDFDYRHDLDVTVLSSRKPGSGAVGSSERTGREGGRQVVE